MAPRHQGEVQISNVSYQRLPFLVITSRPRGKPEDWAPASWPLSQRVSVRAFIFHQMRRMNRSLNRFKPNGGHKVIFQLD